MSGDKKASRLVEFHLNTFEEYVRLPLSGRANAVWVGRSGLNGEHLGHDGGTSGRLRSGGRAGGATRPQFALILQPGLMC